MALGYNTLALLKLLSGTAEEPVGLALRWQLNRVVRECWESAGISGGMAWRGADISLAMLARSKTVYANAQTPLAREAGTAIAAAIILENYDADDFRKILGVNRFNDVTWFNKEAFGETLFLAPFFLAHESPEALGEKTESTESRRKRIETIAAVAEAFRLAEEASGYRLDELPVVLSGNERVSEGKHTGKGSGRL
jgi:hypothetical protein